MKKKKASKDSDEFRGLIDVGKLIGNGDEDRA